MKHTRRSRHTFARFAGVLTLSTIFASASFAAVGAQESDTDDDDGTDDLEGSDSLVTVQNGEYEPCTAFFGYGKDDAAMDLVSFEVDVEGDGASVGDGVDVVFVIETTSETVVCEPVAVTEGEWDDAWSGLLAYPSQAVYPYPSIGYGAQIDGADVTSVAYQVVGIPDGYTLVSPPAISEVVESELVALASIFPSFDDLALYPNPLVGDIVDDLVGAGPAGAWNAAVAGCPTAPSPSADLAAAMVALSEYASSSFPATPTCGQTLFITWDVVPVFYGNETLANVAGITLEAQPVPPVPPGPPGPTPSPDDEAAAPVEAAPAFTG